MTTRTTTSPHCRPTEGRAGTQRPPAGFGDENEGMASAVKARADACSRFCEAVSLMQASFSWSGNFAVTSTGHLNSEHAMIPVAWAFSLSLAICLPIGFVVTQRMRMSFHPTAKRKRAFIASLMTIPLLVPAWMVSTFLASRNIQLLTASVGHFRRDVRYPLARLNVCKPLQPKLSRQSANHPRQIVSLIHNLRSPFRTNDKLHPLRIDDCRERECQVSV